MKSHMPKISIFLSSFNHAKYIREAIESVLNQTFMDFELIIWDDGSTDNSWDLINQYSDPRIKAFRNVLNIGGAVGVNKAITEVALGKYIAIHHSDDVWELDKLEKQITYLEAHNEAGAVFTNAFAIAENGMLLPDEEHFYADIFNQNNRTRHEWLRFFFIEGNALCHPSVLIRKSCYEDCGLYNRGMAQVTDLDMWIRLCLKYEIHVLPKKLVKFRVRDNEANSSGNRPETRIRSAYELYKLLPNYLKITRFDDLVKVFSSAQKYNRDDETDMGFVFAMVLLEESSMPFNRLFAMDILFEIIADPERAANIKRLYEFDYKSFIELSGKNDIFSMEVVAERDAKIASLNQSNAERGDQIANLNQAVAERDGQIANLTQAVAERDGQIANLTQAVAERDGLIANLTQAVAERDGLIANLSGSIREIRGSTSWRVTVPLRFLSSITQKIRSVLFILPQVLQQGGGLWATISKTVNTFRNEGLVGARIKLRWFFARQQENLCAQIQAMDSTVIESIESYRQYEEQHDYSSSIVHADIRVLSYYLPQFHPIPENDLWHGKGFTEWTKVSASAPLFEGHYQQHIPHPDIGYYLLESPDTLRLQAEQMQKSGVHGQVFYHYWFSGKLILEEPAQLLLNTPDIQMPFCFCWANENWTRRWDGNENEILLGQNYSAQDAHDFIHYLIPFFKDPRYIKVEGRPMLFVYRPSSIPNSQEYLDIWEAECAKAGVKRPYVVAVLTRGAINPNDFGMDAGVERVLHDWTGGAVPEIKNALRRYLPINGSVLPYEEVASFYMKQTEAKDFTYFRSLVPIWDNTARYGSEAYLLHGSSPQRFQEWMESTIAYTQSTLPSDRRFVLVNAWNEWAEGAHLEPDTRYGYSYLNSVGRALAGVAYSGELNPVCAIPAGTKLHLSLSESTLNQLQRDPVIKQRFISCLSQSSVLGVCSVSINASDLITDLPIQADSDDADFILECREVVFFDSDVIEKMLQTALVSGTAVIANDYGENSSLLEVTENGSVNAFVANTAPLLLIPKSAKKSGYKNVRMRTDAHCFLTCQSSIRNTDKPVVTTIIRFHKSANLSELKNALYCLYAMQNCIVTPLIAAQDLDEHQIEALQNMLSGFTWMQGCEPQVHHYQSQDGKGDLRSKMLNESLKKVKTRYAAFLDFDDLLMPCAYGWLIDRLIKSGKAVSFGRAYATSYDCARELILERKRTFEYGYSYKDFVNCNHAPLHSFMLDMERLDLSHITYFEDQRYMEDYLLTLQLFTKDNCDWDSLKENYYLGDYIHSIYRNHTLALSNENERQTLLSNPEYMICEQRICDARKSLSLI